MPSAADTVTFQNKKRKIFDNLIAVLQTIGIQDGEVTGFASKTTGQSGTLGQTTTISYTEVLNKARIKVRQSFQVTNSTATITVHLRRGTATGTIIASQVHNSGGGFPFVTFSFDVFEDNRPVASQLYTVTFLMSVFSGGVGADFDIYDPAWNGNFGVVNLDINPTAKNTNILSG